MADGANAGKVARMKRRDWGRAAGITAIPLLLALSASPAYAVTSVRTDDGGSLSATVGPRQSVSAARSAPGPCIDSAYSLLGGKWKQTLNWRYQSSSKPAGLNGAKVLKVIKRSFDNITGARNDCGLADTVSATAQYLGTTSTKPNVSKRARCSPSDGLNVVGFGRLPNGILAVTWLSSKWPNRAPAETALLRTFVGGSRDPEALARTDAELVGRSLDAMRPVLALRGEPLFTRVYRFERASAQHEVGHRARMREIDRRLAAQPGLFLTGSGFRGVGIPDCIADARAQAARAGEWIQHAAAEATAITRRAR